MSEKFENTIKKVGKTKYITAPVDVIRSGVKPNGAMPEKKSIFSLRVFVVIILVVVVAFGVFYFLNF